MFKKKNKLVESQIIEVKKDPSLMILQGKATLSDLMSPPSIEFFPEFFNVGSMFCSSMAVTFYPRELYPGWMQGLTSLDVRCDISMHIHPVEKRIVDSYLKRKLAGLQSTQNLEAEKGKIQNLDEQANMDDIELLRYKLFTEKENFFQVTLLINAYGSSKTELENNISFLMNSIREIGIDVKILKLQQKQGIESILPYGKDTVKNYHNFYTSALATSFPFTQANIQIERGVLYGESLVSGTPFFYDIFNKQYNDNYNKVIIGWSGSGKSFTTKLLASRYAIRGSNIMVIDPTTQEYVSFAKRLGGQIIDVSPEGSTIINPFDLAQTQEAFSSNLKSNEGGTLAQKVQYLKGLFEIMLNGNITPIESAILDQAINFTYMTKGINRNNPKTFNNEPPTMADFDLVLTTITNMPKIIDKYKNKKPLTPLEKSIFETQAFRTNKEIIRTASNLKLKIDPYINGNLSHMFNGQTNVVLSNRVVVFNVGNTPEKQIPLAMYIVFGEILNKVLSGGGKRESIVVLDEAWKILKHSGAADSVQVLIKEGRKMLCSTWMISQELSDYEGSQQGLTALRNASVKILLKSTPAAMEEQKRFFRLSDGNAEFLTKATPGQGIMLMEKNQSVVAFYARPSDAEKQMASTTYSELDDLVPPKVDTDFSLIQDEQIDPVALEHLQRKALEMFGEKAITPLEDQSVTEDLNDVLDEEIFKEI